MLRIHTDQKRWFAERARRDFVARMSGYLREHFAAWLAPLGDLETWLQRVIEHALEAHIATEPEVAQVVMLYLAVDLDDPVSATWIRPILQDRRLQANGKVRSLVAEARRRNVPHVDEIDLTATLETEALEGD